MQARLACSWHSDSKSGAIVPADRCQRKRGKKRGDWEERRCTVPVPGTG